MDLQLLIDAWHDTSKRIIELLRSLPDDAWEQPTGCPGWTVRDVAAHLAAIETELAGGDGPVLPEGATAVTADYTQLGVEERAQTPGPLLIDELERAVAARVTALHNVPADPAAVASPTPGGVRWSWEVLLRNRVVDLWTHEQDIRHALSIPGGTTDPGAKVTLEVFASALPFILGKVVGAPAGTTATWMVEGDWSRTTCVEIGDDGRGRVTEPVDNPTVALRMTTGRFFQLAAGRQAVDPDPVDISGDAELGEQILRSMAVTP